MFVMVLVHTECLLPYYNFAPKISSHSRLQIKEKWTCALCFTLKPEKSKSKIYSRKEFLITETSISDFNEKFKIPAIKNCLFHLPHVSALRKRTPQGLQTMRVISICVVSEWLCRVHGSYFWKPNTTRILFQKYICINIRYWIRAIKTVASEQN